MGRQRYKVPSKDYSIQYSHLLPEILPELEEALRQENPILGAPVAAFEEEFAAWCGTDYAVGLNSGTDALILSLRALGIGPGDEVITNGNTFIATVSAILLVGARPILVDPDQETMNISVAGVEAALTPHTAAVIPAHLYGLISPMPELSALCAIQGIALLEDAAQAHGACGPGNKQAGTWGGIGCFSFHPSKNLGAFGDGGMAVTSEKHLADKLRQLRNLGKTSKYVVRHVAPNTKLDTLQAVILRIKLRHLDEWTARRREIAARYYQEIQDVGDLILPCDPGDNAHVYHLFVVRTEKRDELRKYLKSEKINAGIHYPIPPHLQKLNLDYQKGDLPITEKCAATVLSLPISYELTDSQIEYTCDRIKKFYSS